MTPSQYIPRLPNHRPGSQHCAGQDTEIWFPEDGSAIKHRDAVEFCVDCPFVAPCLAFALDRPTIYGIYGGTTHKQRKQARAQRGRRAA